MCLVSRRCHVSCVSSMCVLCQGASVHRREEISGWTPLHAAAFAAKSSVLAQLVAHGAALECLDHAGEWLDDARFLALTTHVWSL
jgi:ankyrin repeat protein